MRRLFFADAPNVWRVAKLDARCFARWIVVALVQTQMLRLLDGRLRPFNDNGIHHQGNQLDVGGVGSADADRQGPAVAFNQDTLPDARIATVTLATVTGVGTDAFVLTPLFPRPLPGTPRAFARQPSAACQSTP